MPELFQHLLEGGRQSLFKISETAVSAIVYFSNCFMAMETVNFHNLYLHMITTVGIFAIHISRTVVFCFHEITGNPQTAEEAPEVILTPRNGSFLPCVGPEIPS